MRWTMHPRMPASVYRAERSRRPRLFSWRRRQVAVGEADSHQAIRCCRKPFIAGVKRYAKLVGTTTWATSVIPTTAAENAVSGQKARLTTLND